VHEYTRVYGFLRVLTLILRISTVPIYFQGRQLEIQSPVRSFIAFILCFHPRIVYVILQHGMSLKMGYMTRGQSSDYSRPYRKYDNPAENTIIVGLFPGYSNSTVPVILQYL
jgi:hypothetical protein